MISLKKRNEGFTIIELLIVIVVIAILAALVLTTYSGAQTKARNSERQSDIKALQTQIEAYYTQNGYYPSRANMNDATWRGTNMKGMEAGALQDPQAAAATLAGAAAASTYAYVPLTSADASCEADATTCAKYTLTATYEGSVGGATTLVKTSLE